MGKENDKTNYDIFISHNHNDYKNIALPLDAYLRARGINSILDPNGQNPYALAMDNVFEQIENSRTLLIIYSENTMHSAYVPDEIKFAEKKGLGIIPVIVNNCKYETVNGFDYNEALGGRNAIRINTPRGNQIDNEALFDIYRYILIGSEFERQYIFENFPPNLNLCITGDFAGWNEADENRFVEYFSNGETRYKLIVPEANRGENRFKFFVKCGLSESVNIINALSHINANGHKAVNVTGEGDADPNDPRLCRIWFYDYRYRVNENGQLSTNSWEPNPNY